MTLNEKLLEIAGVVSFNSQRFYLLIDAMGRGEASDEQLAAILGLSVDEVERARSELQTAISAWNVVEASLQQAAEEIPETDEV